MHYEHQSKPAHIGEEDMSVKIAEAKQSNIISNLKQLKNGL